MAESDEYLTVNEVAERLKVNPQTVRDWIDRGELEAVRVGSRRIRARLRALETFLGGPPVTRVEAREAFSEALSETQAAGDDGELASWSWLERRRVRGVRTVVRQQRGAPRGAGGVAAASRE